MNNIISLEFKFKNNLNEIINGDIRLPARDGKFPLIIMSHGFRAWKDWGFNPYIAAELCRLGAITLTFNFSLNGRIKNPNFIDVDKFARMTISQELSDLNSVIDYFISDLVPQSKELKNKWNQEIILIGFSLGGGISILQTLNDKRINKLVLWSSIGRFDRYTEHQKKEWELKGFLESPNRETNQMLKLNYDYLQDIEKNKKLFNLADAIGAIEIPILIIHSEKDLAVPLVEVQMLFDAKKNYNIRKKIVKKTGHTFGIGHPMGNISSALAEALIEIKDFLFNF